MILERFLATVLVKWRRKNPIMSQHLEIGFHTDQILAYQLNCTPAFLPIVCLKITCMELMYFKDFPAIHWEIKKEEGAKVVGWLDSSSPGQDHNPGVCKTGHRPAVLDPVLRQGLGVSVLTLKPGWKWAVASSPALAPRKEQPVPQLCVVQHGPACPVVRCHGQEMHALAGRSMVCSPLHLQEKAPACA